MFKCTRDNQYDVVHIYLITGQYRLQKRELESVANYFSDQLGVGVDGGHGSWVHRALVLGQHNLITPLTKLHCYLINECIDWRD